MSKGEKAKKKKKKVGRLSILLLKNRFVKLVRVNY